MTAALGLYKHLGLPQPWTPAETPVPLIVYGGSGAVGSFAIKLAALSNIHPIIVVAGRGEKYVASLLDKSKGDAIVDYRKGDEAVVQGIRDALKAAGASSVSYAFDAVSERGSYQNIYKVLDPYGKITLVLSSRTDTEVPENITQSGTMVGDVHGQRGLKPGAKEFGFVFFRYFGHAFQLDAFTGHPHEVVPGGLGGVEGSQGWQSERGQVCFPHRRHGGYHWQRPQSLSIYTSVPVISGRKRLCGFDS